MSDQPSTVVAAEAVEYRDIPGYPGYRVGSDGSVWSCATRGGGKHKKSLIGDTWRRLSPASQRNNHLTVDLRGKLMYVHRLVLMAFVGPCPDGMEGCHFPDRDPTNNRLENLRWGTKKDNAADRSFHGTQTGENNPRAKLTENQVRVIRGRHAAGGTTMKNLAREYGVSECLIRFIVRREVWKHVV